MTELVEMLEWMRADLKGVMAGIKWADGMGYSRLGRGLDAARGASLAKTEDDEDKGPRYDLGLGDYPARAALHNVTGRLARAEARMNGAWLACGQTRMVYTSTSMVDPGEMWTLATMEASLKVIVTLCDVVALDYERLSDALARRRVFRAVGKAYEQVHDALGGLQRALNRGEEAQPSVPECINPGCKNMADIRELVNGKTGMKEGGLCSTCARMRRLNGSLPSGHRIHRELDREPWKNQNKRRANGMDHGDESLSWAFRAGIVDK